MLDMSMRERYPFYTGLPYSWYGVAYSDEVAVGEVKSLRYFGKELVVWRDQRGSAHVMDAFCAHLGAHLGHGGKVEDCRLICPFHGWEWDEEGNNVAIPYSDRVHEKAKIHSWPVCERNGLIMTWYHPHGEPPKWEIPLSRELASGDYLPFVKKQWDINTTWQDTAENGADYVHLKYVHHTPELPEVISYETDGPVNRVELAVTYYTPRGDVKGRIISESHGPGYAVVNFAIGDFARLMMIDWAVPLDLEKLRNHKAYAVHKDTRPSIGEGFIKDLVQQMEDDITIFDHKRYISNPPLVAGDGPIAKFRRWASQFYVTDSAAE